jgi:hypothetical protein
VKSVLEEITLRRSNWIFSGAYENAEPPNFGGSAGCRLKVI